MMNYITLIIIIIVIIYGLLVIKKEDYETFKTTNVNKNININKNNIINKIEDTFEKLLDEYIEEEKTFNPQKKLIDELNDEERENIYDSIPLDKFNNNLDRKYFNNINDDNHFIGNINDLRTNTNKYVGKNISNIYNNLVKKTENVKEYNIKFNINDTNIIF